MFCDTLYKIALYVFKQVLPVRTGSVYNYLNDDTTNRITVVQDRSLRDFVSTVEQKKYIGVLGLTDVDVFFF